MGTSAAADALALGAVTDAAGTGAAADDDAKGPAARTAPAITRADTIKVKHKVRCISLISLTKMLT
jgi:hypothetical protein